MLYISWPKLFSLWANTSQYRDPSFSQKRDYKYVTALIMQRTMGLIRVLVDLVPRKGDVVAWWLRRLTSMPEVGGSIPAQIRLHSNTLRQGMNP